MVERIADAVHAATGRSGRPAELKVILETGELVDDDAVLGAARLAVTGGADFIKTSTGKTSVSATPRAVQLMADVVAETDRAVGLKPSGGIRTVDEAMHYLGIVGDRLGGEWATPDTFRFGASSLLDDAIAVAASE
jgi:deoxyribose-phosphate aldolase